MLSGAHLGSTLQIANTLEEHVSAHARREKIQLQITLSATERITLEKLNQSNDFGLNLASPLELDPLQLNVKFERLTEIEASLSKSSDKLLIKKYKLAIIQAVENNLQQLKLQRQVTEEVKKQDALAVSYLRRIGYGFLLLIGLMMDGIGSFLGGQELISLIPSVTDPIAMAVGAGFSLINSILFYYFEATLLKQAMGIDDIDEASSHLELDDAELESTQNINRLMQNTAPKRFDKETFAAYAKITGSFNKHLTNKTQYQHDELPETLGQKIFRHSVTVAGAIMTAGNSYFMANALLTFACASLIGTPAGWIMIGLGVATMLVYFLSMRGKAMVNMLDPAFQKFKEIKTKFTKFENKSENDLLEKYEEQDNYRRASTLKKENTHLKEQTRSLIKPALEFRLGKRNDPRVLEVMRRSHSLFDQQEREKEKNEKHEEVINTHSLSL